MDAQKELKIMFGLIFLVFTLNVTSAIIVDAEYITIYPGEQKNIKINIENNLDYDIEDVSIALNLDSVPFNFIGSSEKPLDNLDSDDDDSATFIIRASTDAIPGDYQIPYTVRYTNTDTDEKENKTGKFGIRISAKTNLDFVVETKNAIVGKQGKISLKVINKGLGEVKFVSVQIFPQNYELLSSDKAYIGNIDSDDSDFATFDVIFRSSNPILSAKITYKDFDNNAKTEIINVPINVYTQEKALELGLIKKPNYIPYMIVAGILFLWYIIRKIKKRKKNKQLRRN